MLKEIDNPFHGIEGLPFVLPMYGKEIPKKDLRRITSLQAFSLPIGEVALVRSHGVSDLGDHYIVVVGGLVDKPNGRRPQVMVIPAPENNPLKGYDDSEVMIALKLEKQAKEEFLAHYHINIEGELVSITGVNSVKEVIQKATAKWNDLNEKYAKGFTDDFRQRLQAEMEGISYVVDMLKELGS